MDKDRLKTDGLIFGRSLQKATKIVSMYGSVEHSAADLAAQQAYAALAPLLKQSREFTLGFMNKRLLLNNVLTADNPLPPLESEFEKRAVVTVTFEASISLGEFKRGLALLAVAPKSVEKAGGFKKLLEQNPLQHVRVAFVARPQVEGEDTLLAPGSESYLLAQGILEPSFGPGGGTASFDSQFRPATGADEGAGGEPGGAGRAAGPGGAGARTILEQAGKSVARALADPGRDLSESVKDLTRLFQQLTPDYLLASLTPAKQKELGGHPAEDLVRDLVEDVTVERAGKRLAEAAPGPVPPAALEETMQLLVRGLRATLVAERLLQKLARFVEEAKLPDEINERIRQEVVWFSLPEADKHARLLSLERLDGRECRRLANYVQDRIKEGKTQKALEVTDHFFATLEKAPAEGVAEQLAWVPELLRMAAGPETSELRGFVVERLCTMLVDPGRQQPEVHAPLAQCLGSVAQSAVAREEYKLAQSIGNGLQYSLARTSTEHAACCGRVLEGLLSPASADRLIQLYLENHGEALSAKTSIGLLKLCPGVGSERACLRLAEETVAPNRLRLLRLIEQLGAPAIQVARQRLTDERWYVVRNACYLLGNLADPELAADMQGALRHADVRVQQAAVTALIKNHVAERAKFLAVALPHLQAHVLELALDELTFLKDPASVDGLECFIKERKTRRGGWLEKAVKGLAAIPSDRAAEVLGGVLADRGQSQSVRRTALVALSCNPSPHAHRLMFIFAGQDESGDELVGECRSVLGVSQP